MLAHHPIARTKADVITLPAFSQPLKERPEVSKTHHVVLEPWNHEFLSSPLAAFVGVDSRNHHVHIMPLLRAASPAPRAHRSRLHLSGAVVQELVHLGYRLLRAYVLSRPALGLQLWLGSQSREQCTLVSMFALLMYLRK